MEFNSFKDIVDYCNDYSKNFAQAVIAYEIANFNRTHDEVIANADNILKIMEESVNYGLEEDVSSRSGLLDNFAKKVAKTPKVVIGKSMQTLISRAMSVSEVNACMGRIAACPTAGASGIVPAVLTTMRDEHNLTREQLIEGLLVASGVGLIIAKNASISGAEAGCMAEAGSASAMAAAAAVHMLGGTTEQICNSVSFAIQNSMGLVCDPVAGLVEIPCIFRNSAGAANAVSCAQMAIAGIPSVIPVDEVIMTMNEIAQLMSVTLRETSQGGLANTKTARQIERRIFK